MLWSGCERRSESDHPANVRRGGAGLAEGSQRRVAIRFRELAAKRVGDQPVVAIDRRGEFEKALQDLRPGVTELYVHPARDTPELRALGDDWPGRVDDHALVTRDSNLKAMLDRAGAALIGWRPLRSLMRAG